MFEPPSFRFDCIGRIAMASMMLLLLLPATSIAGGRGSPTDISGPGIDLSEPSPGEFVVDEARGERAGNNLIHVFDNFDLDSLDPANPDSVTFRANQATNNVINVITDPGGSWINGEIRSAPNTSGADFYFLNPYGLMFGPNATLDIGGSFHASTADRLEFGAQTLNVLSPAADLTILTTNPTAFGFLDSRSSSGNGDISINAQNIPGGDVLDSDSARLEVAPNKTLSLIARNVRIEGGARVRAPGGRINIVAVTGAGVVVPDTLAPGEWSIPFSEAMDVSSFATLGDVQIIRNATVDVSSNPCCSGAPDVGVGAIVIRGGELQLAVGGHIEALSSSDLESAPIAVDIDLAGEFNMSGGSTIEVSDVGATFAGGDIRIEASEIEISSSTIRTEASGGGEGGAIILRAANGVSLRTGTDAAIESLAYTTSIGGNVLISADQFTAETAGISSELIDGVFGAGGRIRISARTVDVLDAVIRANVTPLADSKFASGPAGDILLSGSERIQIGQGEGSLATISSTFNGTGTEVGRTGAGNINLQTQDLVMNGGTINVTAIGYSVSEPDPRGGGGGVVSGGSVEIITHDLTMTNRASIIGSSLDQAVAPDILIMASGDVALTGSAEFRHPGGVGRDLVAIPGTMIATSASRSAGAGSITVHAHGLTIDGAEIYSGTFNSDLDAGSITIRSDSLELKSGATISSSTLGVPTCFGCDPMSQTGNAGLISITSDSITLTGVSPDMLQEIPLGGLGAKRDGQTAIQSRSGRASAGDAGRISLNAETILIQDYARVDSSAKRFGSANNLDITAGSLQLLNNASLTTSITDSIGDAATIKVTADSLHMSNGSIIASTSAWEAGGNILSTGNAGNIEVDINGDAVITASKVLTLADRGAGGDIDFDVSGSLRMMSGSEVTSRVLDGPGDGGDVTLDVSDLMSLSYSDVTSDVVSGSGTAGQITVLADQFITSFSTISSTAGSLEPSGDPSTGSAGQVVIEINTSARVNNSEILTQAAFGAGSDASITIKSERMFLRNTQVTTDALTGSRNAGTITVDADYLEVTNGTRITSTAGSVDIEPVPTTGNAGSVNIIVSSDALFDTSQVLTEADLGMGGNIDFEVTGDLALNDSQVSTRVLSGGTIGGNITITSERMELRSTEVTADALGGSANAGTITMIADYLEMTNGTSISSTAGFGDAENPSEGNAGTITIDINGDALVQASKVLTQADLGPDPDIDGDIDFNVAGFLEMIDSEVSTSVLGGSGDGGDIALSSELMVLRSSSVTADAVSGTGGNVTITADQFFKTADTVIRAVSELSEDGEVVLNTPDVNGIESSLVSLPTNLLSAAEMFQPTCLARAVDEDEGSFVVARRVGRPASPEGLLIDFDVMGGGGATIVAEFADENPSVASAPQGGDDDVLLAMNEIDAGARAFRGGDFEQASEHWELASTHYPEDGNHIARADALRGVAQSQQALGKFEESLATLRGALTAAEKSGDPARIASVLGSLGNTHLAKSCLRAVSRSPIPQANTRSPPAC